MRRPAWRRTCVSRPPQVLALQLLRSVWDERTGRSAKDTRHVAFPLVLPYAELVEELGGCCSGGGGGGGAGGAPGGGGGGSGASVKSGHAAEPGGAQHTTDREEEAEAGEQQQDGGTWNGCTCTTAAAQPPYELAAVVVHLGGAASGHYLVYRRVPLAAVAEGAQAAAATAVCAAGAWGVAGRGGSGPGAVRAGSGLVGGHVWLRVSDSSVCRAEVGEVLRQPAALLLYEQRLRQ